MDIIQLDKGRISEALELVWQVFQEFEAPEYSKEGIEEFKNYISYKAITKMMDKEELHFWGSFNDEKLTGVIATRGFTHISLLFVNKQYQRQGIARKLFETIKDACIKEGCISKITVNSSPYAKDFYHAVGFIDTDKEQIVNGIRFIPMLYRFK